MKRAPIPAYVNHGRWVADCPACRTGLQLPRGPRQVKAEFVQVSDACVSCEYPIQVVMPEDADLIDNALASRRLMVNRNWYPHESVGDLLAENLLHLESVS